MKFTPVTSAGAIKGYELQTEHALFFFGTKHLARERLRPLYPEYEFAFLKQVHGRDVVVASTKEDAAADAHVTGRATLALAVQTADCVPVLLASRHQVAAIHAGWRGLAANIIEATARHFVGDPVLACAIGPHIQKKSFEISSDVGRQLLAAAPSMEIARTWSEPSGAEDRVFFDLHALARAQVLHALGANIPIFALTRDTRADEEFSSFRRDGTGGRQFSFVVLNA